MMKSCRVRRVLLPLGLLLVGLVPAGESQAAISRRIVPELDLALFLLQTSDPYGNVNTAIADLEKALVILGFPPNERKVLNPVGRLVLHDRHKWRRAVILLNRTAMQMRVSELRARGVNQKLKLRDARILVHRAVKELQNQLRMPFLF